MCHDCSYLKIWQLENGGDGTKLVFRANNLVARKFKLDHRQIVVAGNTKPGAYPNVRVPVEAAEPCGSVQIAVKLGQNISF